MDEVEAWFGNGVEALVEVLLDELLDELFDEVFEDELFEESLELEDELLPEVDEEDELQEFMVVEDEEFEDEDEVEVRLEFWDVCWDCEVWDELEELEVFFCFWTSSFTEIFKTSSHLYFRLQYFSLAAKYSSKANKVSLEKSPFSFPYLGYLLSNFLSAERVGNNFPLIFPS